MNPFTFLANMKPIVKIFIVACITAILIVAMFTGYFDDILKLFGGE